MDGNILFCEYLKDLYIGYIYIYKQENIWVSKMKKAIDNIKQNILPKLPIRMSLKANLMINKFNNKNKIK